MPNYASKTLFKAVTYITKSHGEQYVPNSLQYYGYMNTYCICIDIVFASKPRIIVCSAWALVY